MNIKEILTKIGATEAPLARQMLMTGLITRVLEDRGKPATSRLYRLLGDFQRRQEVFDKPVLKLALKVLLIGYP